MTFINPVSIEKLLRAGSNMDAYLKEVKKEVSVAGTKAVVHFYLINFDGNQSPRVADLAEFLSFRLLDYCIPRDEIQRAKEEDLKNNSSVQITKLGKKAKLLLTDLEKTGEGGELMLYALAQEYLKMPQLLCKMPLKTSSQMHVHGVDGVHVKFDPGSGCLAIYWGESKMHQTFGSAVDDCFESVGKFLSNTGGSGTQFQRELQLMISNIDLLDNDLEEAILTYLDKDHVNYTKAKNCAVCLVAFDYKRYPLGPNQTQLQDLLAEAIKKVDKWIKRVGTSLVAKAPLHTYDIELFIVPFPSVDGFRQSFLEELGLK
ncbi:HamA C-terminal domain-containing protein [Rufibacter tibetensis]|uniref:Anti-bacteriophage protein A/HamA C-terminal domain-containing protein n=1 Tax=Rufibacter tibetensis TaxID=512763 RepID=A0A0N7HWD3_9BACT|nr:DUF1837 domain-containing protein [Rufibacter tibetensis]ALI98928.1 hypothetical protein DC20_07985 [Rufibacter tibetensis]